MRRRGDFSKRCSRIRLPPKGRDRTGTFLRQTLMDTLVTERKVQRIIGAYRRRLLPCLALAACCAVAALVAARMPTRVYFVSLSGFDTHSNQVGQHAALLTQLSEALAAFQRDLEAKKLDRQVTTMTFSEFGRRPSENESRGTDHGTAAPLFVMGSAVKAGLHGTPPSLKLERNQDLEFSTDPAGIRDWALSAGSTAPRQGADGKV
jgi:hypothetical protein